MTMIIAGGFMTSEGADAAMRQLLAAGASDANVCSFRVNPPGEHDDLPIGGDRDESPGANKASGGAVSGATIGTVAGAAAGALASTVLGPIAIAGGAGVGAYTGALVGALNSMDKGTHREEVRPAENLVAVNVGSGEISAEQAILIFEQCGATQVERAEGTWSSGEWSDFDPVMPPNLIGGDRGQRPAPEGR
ncbi:MAG TPA: hypothetical protein VM029_21815 [Opitutaceae bacterium]|nr:hypothetical protein [Opitutaceae bacterium]